MARDLYHTRQWRVVQPYVLRRDMWRCRLRLPGCTQHARAVDHIVRPDDGGAPFDVHNLQASCTHCNTVKENWRREGKTPQPPPSRDW